MTDTVRPEIYREVRTADELGVTRRRIPAWQSFYNQGWLRKSVLLVVLASLWQAYSVAFNNPLLLPTFTDTIAAMIDGFLHGPLLLRTVTSIQTLLIGYAIGIVVAAVITVFAIQTKLGTDILETLTAMFNPLPAIALLPLALIWFGLGTGSVVFVLVHSVMWAIALNAYSGFRSVSPTLQMVGRNYGLKGFRFVRKVLIPAASPSLFAGLKIGWAFAWRTLIAAELVFGVSSGSGGLGWFIYERKNALDIPSVFAGLVTIILVGLLVENGIFRVAESRTVQRWGMRS